MKLSVGQAQEYRREMTVKVEIHTERFLLRELTIGDVSSSYLDWLSDDEAKKWIAAAVVTKKLPDLRQYVLARIGRDDILFLGIFDNMNGLHIGNIKYEPLDIVHGYAVMGMLIGEREWRGKGVAEEVIQHSAAWLQHTWGIREILLGVAKDNPAAISAYEKAGFKREQTKRVVIDPESSISMVLHLDA